MNHTTTKPRRPLMVGTIVIVLVVIGYLGWNLLRESHGHTHDHDDHSAGALALNAGEKWATDEPLRLGMQRIRDAVISALAGPEQHKLNQEQAKSLADTVQKNVTYLIQNCKLEPAADANLHVLITELMQGAAMVSSNPPSHEGVAKLVHALSAYPKYFDHPNWQPLPEPKS